MIGALLAAAVAVASPGAREGLAGLLAAKLNGPRICWEADDVDAIVLVSIGSDGATESIDGPRGPTISDTVELLDPASPWYGVNADDVGPCPRETLAVK